MPSKIFLTISFALLCLTTSNAQTDSIPTLTSTDSSSADSILTSTVSINIEPTTITLKKKYVTAFRCDVASTPEQLTEAWKTYLKDNYSLRPKSKKDIFIAQDVNLIEITDHTLTTYSQVTLSKNLSRIIFGLEYSNGIQLDSASHPNVYNNTKNFLYKFVKGYYVDYYTSLLNKLRGQHLELLTEKESLVKNQKSVQGTNVLLNKEIANAASNKLRAEQVINRSKNKIDQKKNEIAFGNQRLTDYTEKIAAIDAKLGSASLTEQEALLKERVSLNKNIIKAEKDTTKASAAILKAEQAITKSEEKIKRAEQTTIEKEDQITLNSVSLEEKDKNLAKINARIDRKQNEIQAMQDKISNIR